MTTSTPSFRMDAWHERVRDGHAREVAKGLHDDQCEWAPNFYLCHCSKRRREASGLTKPPTEDLYFPPPGCPHCGRDLHHDGDGWNCYRCALIWGSDGSGSSARFTDDHGDLSWCEIHAIRACHLDHPK